MTILRNAHDGGVGRVFRRLAPLAGVSALLLLTSGCASEDLPRLGLPEASTAESPSMIFLWQTSWIAALAVGAVTWGLMAWAVVAYSRRRRPGYPEQTRYNMPLEILYTVVPFLMIGVLFFFTARDEARLTALSNDYKNAVNVVGFRWSWTFNYVNDNAYDTGIPAVNQAGASDPAQKDKAGYLGPTLWLPVGEKTRFILNSPDVIHSFYIPAFLYKMDVFPGRTNQFELTPTREGTFLGKCAELCGVDHSRMLFQVKVVSRAEYLKHIAALKAAGQSGQLKTGFNTGTADQGQGRTVIGKDGR